MVRCGRCANVFDGFKTLATLRADTPSEAAPPVFRDDVLDAEVTPLPPVGATPASTFEMSPAASQPEEIAALESQPLPVAQTFSAEILPQRRGGWAFGIFVLLIVAAAQGAYFYRSEIAAGVPEARPHLNKMCELLRCTVALPQDPRQITIVGSDMQVTDPANPGLIVLTVTLRSTAKVELGYPALDVVLTNALDHYVARRIFLPAEYLDAGKATRAGISPNAEITVRLNLDNGELGAAGFRLDLIAAPVH